MIRVVGFLLVALSLVSCQFTETMVMNEDGTGRMTLSVDMGEIMAMSNEFAKDSSLQKTDTIISFKDILAEKKDSISKLSKAQQKRLKAMENYNIHMASDPENKEFVMDVFTDFKNVSEANDLMKGFDLSSDYMPGANKNSEEKAEQSEDDDVLGVKFSYSKGHFKRDAYIMDQKRYQQQLDSLTKTESFMSGISYKLKYTFPRKIKSTTAEDATFSLDGKTMELERSFLEYFKNPDVLDVEVELEN